MMASAIEMAEWRMIRKKASLNDWFFFALCLASSSISFSWSKRNFIEWISINTRYCITWQLCSWRFDWLKVECHSITYSIQRVWLNPLRITNNEEVYKRRRHFHFSSWPSELDHGGVCLSHFVSSLSFCCVVKNLPDVFSIVALINEWARFIKINSISMN